MTETLFSLTYKVARSLGAVLEGHATGGSTATIVDTVERVEADDYWVRGTAWILKDAAGAGAAPEGEMSVISDYVQSTATITLRDALTAAVGAGDKYALGKRRYPLSILTQKINAALQTMGTIPITDITTIPQLVAGQSEYSLPIRAGMHLAEVHYALSSDPVDHEWMPLLDWEVQDSPIGTADILIVPGPHLTVGNAIKLVYMDVHPDLHEIDDELSDGVHPDRVTVQAALLTAEWRRQKVGGGDPSLPETMTKLERDLGTLTERQPIVAPPVQAKLLIVKRQTRRYPGDQNPL